MEHIRTRNEMVEAFLKRSPTRAIGRAIQEGRITLYGGFTEIPPFNRAGWIGQVRSRHGRTWHLGLLVDEITHTYACHILGYIPWENWAGKIGGKGIHDGDCPARVYGLRSLSRWAKACVERQHADSEE